MILRRETELSSLLVPSMKKGSGREIKMDDKTGNAKISMDRVVRHLIRNRITISVMESCTGGLFASFLTDTEGASEIFSGSFVTYSNEAKVRCGVPEEVIRRFGVYSVETAAAMAAAAQAAYGAEIGVGITGTMANPDPHNADSVPGEVWYAIRRGDREKSGRLLLGADASSRRAWKERVVFEVASALAVLLGLSDCET